MKKFAKRFVAAILGWQVRRLRKKNSFTVITVAGSIGKTSTKFAVSNVLKKQYKVCTQEGNYNDIVTVPLVFFGHPIPSLFNPFAWIKVFLANEKKLKKNYPYDFVVLEIGTDGPGQIAQFGKYVHSDITIISALTMEHMENFRDMDHVAEEELSVQQYSNKIVINTDLAAKKHIEKVRRNLTTFAKSASADYKISDVKFGTKQASFVVEGNGQKLSLKLDAVGMGEVYSAACAAVIALDVGMDEAKIIEAVGQLEPVPGRMQRLKGVNNSLILDETYNASPAATKAALDSLYEIKAKQKIAILGNMNELGKFSEEAHKDVGEYCDAKQLDLVVTLGPDSNKFLAAAAEAKGCNVERFDDPRELGEFLKHEIKPGAVVLAKGSQNKVFAEEAVKIILANKADQKLLVRQSPDWLKTKEKNFGW